MMEHHTKNDASKFEVLARYMTKYAVVDNHMQKTEWYKGSQGM